MRKNNSEEKITIEAELPIALEELAIYTLPKKRDASEILDLLNTKPELANYEMEKIARSIIRKKKLDVRLKSLEHDYNDSDNLTHGVAYFKVELEGTEITLKKITGENQDVFFYDWQTHGQSNQVKTM
jgi:hypothetical protein